MMEPSFPKLRSFPNWSARTSFRWDRLGRLDSVPDRPETQGTPGVDEPLVGGGESGGRPCSFGWWGDGGVGPPTCSVGRWDLWIGEWRPVAAGGGGWRCRPPRTPHLRRLSRPFRRGEGGGAAQGVTASCRHGRQGRLWPSSMASASDGVDLLVVIVHHAVGVEEGDDVVHGVEHDLAPVIGALVVGGDDGLVEETVEA